MARQPIREPNNDPASGRATVRDVARICGVSPMTVSRVLNHSPLVAAETAARVRAAMAQADFRPNHTARNLRQRRTSTMIGLVVDDIANPFYARLSRAVEEVARANDALLVVSSYGKDPEQERGLVATLLERGVDGLLIYPTGGDHSYLQSDLMGSRPVVLLGRRPDGVDVDAVVADNVGGAMHAVEHLHARGHRRIGVVGYGRRGNVANEPAADHRSGRVEGYRRGLESVGLPYDPRLVRLHCAGTTQAATAVRKLLALADPPTALFTMNNRMTIGALGALGPGLAGLALVGFDDFELADVFDPAITVVTHDAHEMGRLATELLVARLTGREPTRGGLITLPTTLIARGSGERTR